MRATAARYYLELLRGGLYPEFWEEMLTGEPVTTDYLCWLV